MSRTHTPNAHKSRMVFLPQKPYDIEARDGLKCTACGMINTTRMDEFSLHCSDCNTVFSMGLYIQVYGYPSRQPHK